jgi:hypothetical protein
LNKNEAEIPLADQVVQRQSSPGVVAGDIDDQAEIRATRCVYGFALCPGGIQHTDRSLVLEDELARPGEAPDSAFLFDKIARSR